MSFAKALCVFYLFLGFFTSLFICLHSLHFRTGLARETPARVDGCVFGESSRSHLTIAGCACEDGCRCQTFTFCSSVTQQHRGDLTAASASSSALKEGIPFSLWPFLSLLLFFTSFIQHERIFAVGRSLVRPGETPTWGQRVHREFTETATRRARSNQCAGVSGPRWRRRSR